MKKILFMMILLTGMAHSHPVHAQRYTPRNAQIRSAMLERIREAKWAFILYKLNLSEKRANQLLPVYTAYEEEKRDIFRGSAGQLPQDDNVTDEQAEQVMNTKLENARKLLDLKEKYKKEFLKVLTPSEVLDLQRAEMEFAVKIQTERQKRKQNGR